MRSTKRNRIIRLHDSEIARFRAESFACEGKAQGWRSFLTTCSRSQFIEREKFPLWSFRLEPEFGLLNLKTAAVSKNDFWWSKVNFFCKLEWFVSSQPSELLKLQHRGNAGFSHSSSENQSSAPSSPRFPSRKLFLLRVILETISTFEWLRFHVLKSELQIEAPAIVSDYNGLCRESQLCRLCNESSRLGGSLHHHSAGLLIRSKAKRKREEEKHLKVNIDSKKNQNRELSRSGQMVALAMLSVCLGPFFERRNTESRLITNPCKQVSSEKSICRSV